MKANMRKYCFLFFSMKENERRGSANMGKAIKVLLVCLCMACTAAACKKEETQVIKIGITVYKINDTFISSIVSGLEEIVKEKQQKEDIKIKLDISDGKGSQEEQNEQVERYISLGYDVICVNLVDRTNASLFIDQAVNAGIPIVFFNREPVAEDIFRDGQIYYIGSDAKKSAIIQGEIVLDAFKNAPEQLDRNGNGIIEYAMVEGEAGHQDTIIRTEYSVRTLLEGGLKLEKTAGFVANFDRNQAEASVSQWLENNKDIPIELFLSNNDDMALGVADALEKAGIKRIPIVGIDGIPQGIEAVNNGKILGTAVSDSAVYGENIFNLAYALAQGEKVSELDTVEIDNERYIWIPWSKYYKKDWVKP